MAITFQCSGCGKSYQVADHLAGETVNCTACERPMIVPASAEAKLELAAAIAEQSPPPPGIASSSGIDPMLLRGPTPPTPPPPGPRPMPRQFTRPMPPTPSLIPPRRVISDEPSDEPITREPTQHIATVAETIASLGPLTDLVADLDVVSPPRVNRPRLWGRSTVLLNDEAARLLSWLLLIALIFCCVWGARHVAGLIRERNDLPEAFKSGFSIFITLYSIKSAVTFFFLFAPTLLLACALACNWTHWDLPGNAYLRACGAATLPSLFVMGWVMLVTQRALIALLIAVIATPFLLIIGLKELMALKWPTTFVAALLLIVIVPVEGIVLAFVELPLNREIATIAGLDEQSFKQWAAAHPEEAAQLRQARGVASPTWSAPAPAPEPPDPLGASLDPTLAEMRQAITKSRAQTKEEIGKARDDFAAKLATLKPAGNAYSRSWNEANAWVSQLADAAASAPSGAVPAELFTPIEDHPLPVQLLDPAAFADESFAFKSVRVTPPKDARIDLKSFATRDTVQRWSIGEAGTIELSVAPAGDAKQQRPWIGDRRVIAELATQRNLFALVIEGKSDATFGRLNGLAWTRAVSRDTFGHATEIAYVARLPQNWLVARMSVQHGYRSQDADADRFVQGLRLVQPGETAPADPYDPRRVVERFGELREDPAEVIRAAGPEGLDALFGYVARLGESSPLRAYALLEDLTASHLSDVDPRPIDVNAALAMIAGDWARDNAKRYGLKRLAVTPPVERRDEIAAALEKLISNDRFGRTSDDAAEALCAWWRPQTVENLLPLLDEKVWPLSKRDAAIKVLAHTRDKQAVFPIVRWIVKYPDGVVPALKSMGGIAEDEVIKLLRQQDPAVRANAARVLNEIGTEKCLLELRRAASDPRDVAAAAVARSALESVLARVKQSKASASTAP